MNFRKTTCRVLVVSMLALTVQAAGAGMIGADRAMPTDVQADRAMVLEVLARAETTSQLQSLGVDPQQARDRVAAMSDQEVTQLAQDVRTAPAAGNHGWAVAAGVIIIAAAIWYFAYRK